MRQASKSIVAGRAEKKPQDPWLVKLAIAVSPVLLLLYFLLLEQYGPPLFTPNGDEEGIESKYGAAP